MKSDLIKLADRLDDNGLVSEAKALDSIIKTSSEQMGLVQALNVLLADEHVLYIKLRNYHWNVEGMQFNDLHAFFETQYDAIAATIDKVAERIRAIGGYAFGTMQEFIQHSHQKEFPDTRLSPQMMLADLERSYGIIIKYVRGLCEMYPGQDPITASFLEVIVEEHEKTLWMIRSLLGG